MKRYETIVATMVAVMACISAIRIEAAEMATHLFPLMDGDIYATRSCNGDDERMQIGYSGKKSVGWIVFQTGGTDLTLAAGASVTLHAAEVFHPGTLKVYALTAPIAKPENQVGPANLAYNVNAPVAAFSIAKADQGRIIRLNLGQLLANGPFHGLVVGSSDGLRADFSSKDSDVPPLIELRYAFTSLVQINQAIEAATLAQDAAAAAAVSAASAASSDASAQAAANAVDAGVTASQTAAVQAVAASGAAAMSAAVSGASATAASASATQANGSATAAAASATQSSAASASAGFASAGAAAATAQAQGHASSAAASANAANAAAAIAGTQATAIQGLAAAAAGSAGAAEASALAAAASAASISGVASFPAGTALLNTNPIPPAGFAYSGIRINYEVPWIAKTAPAIARSEMASAVAEGKLYSAGGTTGSAVTSIVQAYDPVAGTWASVAGMPSGLRQHSMVESGGTLYVTGGIDNANNPRGSCFRFDPAAGAWTTLSSMPVRWGHASVASGGRIYVFGGFDASSGHMTATAVYDIPSDTWITGSPLPTWRAQMQAKAVGGRIYVIGGTTQTFPPVTVGTNEVYDIAADTWATAAPMAVGRSGFGAFTDNCRIYVIGGDVGSGGPSGSTLQYDPAVDSWLPLNPMIQGRRFFALGLINGKAYAGMGFGSANLATTEEYLLPKTLYLIEKL